MSNLALVEDKKIAMWEDNNALQEIRTIFAPTLSEMEWKTFIEMGKASGLNPFLKEIWAVKYDQKVAAQIFVGRDGYRKSAQRSPYYEYHLADAVYSNDFFEVEDGKVKHKYNLKDRGNLVGAYCIVKRKGSAHPNYVFADLKEYDTKQSVWVNKKATMIKKVAEAQGLKSAFQELFAGTYHEAEYVIEDKQSAQSQGKGIAGLKDKLGLSAQPETAIEYEAVEVEDILDHEVKESEQQEEEELTKFDNVLKKIEKADSVQQLIDAVDLARGFTEDKKVILRESYAKQKKILDAKEMPI